MAGKAMSRESTMMDGTDDRHGAPTGGKTQSVGDTNWREIHHKRGFLYHPIGGWHRFGVVGGTNWMAGETTLRGVADRKPSA
jgi:hypothetical protein